MTSRLWLGLVRLQEGDPLAERLAHHVVVLHQPGDAFSTAQTIPRSTPGSKLRVEALLDGAFWHEPSSFDPLCRDRGHRGSRRERAVRGETTPGREGNVLHALPVDRTLQILDRHGRLAR